MDSEFTGHVTKTQGSTSKPSRPIEDVRAAQAFYAKLGQDVEYFSALWHIFNVGHMMSTDLDRICREHGYSIADFNLMGALRVERKELLRATDLAVTLQVSNAALTHRINKLADLGVLVKEAIPEDRRAFRLALTRQGALAVDAIHAAIEEKSQFVRHFREISEADREAVESVMGDLHTRLDRDFIHAHR